MDGFDAGCLRFAVRFTPPHARLASGCWLGSTGWDWLPTRLQRKVSEVVVTSHPPFPNFSWRNLKNAPSVNAVRPYPERRIVDGVSRPRPRGRARIRSTHPGSCSKIDNTVSVTP